MGTENIEIVDSSLNGDGNEEDIVNPWSVQSKSDAGIDYDKLISKLKFRHFSNSLIIIHSFFVQSYFL